MLVCTAAQMREIDRTTIEDFGVPGVVLMECAGRGVVKVIAKLRPIPELRVVVLCGGGNNGGDGFVVARHLLNRGARVRTYIVADTNKISGDAAINLRVLEKMGADLQPLRNDEELHAAERSLAHAHVLVDALLGTGLNAEVTGQYRKVIERANRCSALKVAVDVPSGLHADHGEVLGIAFAADHTVTFGYPKLGLVSHPGAERAGELHVCDIGIPTIVESKREFAAELLEEQVVRRWLLDRPTWGHKGTYGHLLVIAGSPGKTGAALLCGQAALRSGAGLCTIASPPAAMRALECKTQEVMLAELLPENAEPDDSDVVFGHLLRLLEGKSAVAIGPGIPRRPGMTALVRRLVRESPLPLVIDADGLNELVGDLECLHQASVPVLLTPHPGEMARLAGLSTAEVQANRVEVARSFAEAHGVYLALKGYRTVIAGPDSKLLINPTGNTGMASGGTGDVLTGVVGSFLAQQQAPLDALSLGVFVHGLAGDRAAARLGQHGLVASDLLTEVAGVLKEWE